MSYLTLIMERVIQNSLFFDLFLYLLLSILIIEIVYLIRTNLILNRYINLILKNEFKKDSFLTGLINNYQEQYKKNGLDTGFIENYFVSNKRKLLKMAKFIERSGSLFIFLGFLGGFVILFVPLLNLDLTGLTGISDILERVSGLWFSLKTAFYSVVIGVACSIVINLVNKFWNTGENLDALKTCLDEYAAKKADKKLSNEEKQIEAINRLLESIENNFTRLEDTLEDTLNDSIGDIEQMLREMLQLMKFSREKEMRSILKQIATISNKKQQEYPGEKQARS